VRSGQPKAKEVGAKANLAGKKVSNDEQAKPRKLCKRGTKLPSFEPVLQIFS
jgi:hypothetical protein